MAARPPSNAGRPGSAARGPVAVPPGTASRLATGMARGQPTGAAGGVALASQVRVADRPMTQQGLGGLKTGAMGRQTRQVQDKSYYLGVLRSKMKELATEMGNLRREVETASEDQSSYLSYEKRAELLAQEINKLQGELGDYNTLVDKLNTDDSANDIQMDLDDLKMMNDREAKTLDSFFEQKQEKERAIKQLEVELQQERSMADNLVADMRPEMRRKYMDLKDLNEHLLRQLEQGQQELDKLNMKKAELEEELAVSPVKQEAVHLYEQLAELEEKRDQIQEEMHAKGSPQDERDKLLKQVKEDNQEIASMERQTHEARDKLSNLQEEIRGLDMDIEENQGERNQKYKELKKRDETMTEFLDGFDETKAQEIERMQQLESNIVMILEATSRNLGRFGHLPSSQELSVMKDDLVFKENEMKKSENTAGGLAGESEKLHQDLQKVEQLEAKITQELEVLKTKIATMTEELEIYSDLDKLKGDAEAKKKKLGEDKVILHKRRETFKKTTQGLTQKYEADKAHLNDNETYTQLGNLERKWQHHEQNNFVMKEFIAAKTMECDYRPYSKRVTSTLADYNTRLQESLSGKGSY